MVLDIGRVCGLVRGLGVVDTWEGDVVCRRGLAIRHVHDHHRAICLVRGARHVRAIARL